MDAVLPLSLILCINSVSEYQLMRSGLVLMLNEIVNLKRFFFFNLIVIYFFCFIVIGTDLDNDKRNNVAIENEKWEKMKKIIFRQFIPLASSKLNLISMIKIMIFFSLSLSSLSLFRVCNVSTF